MKNVEVSILGQRLKIKTDEQPEYVRELARFVNDKMEEVKKKTRSVSTHSVAMLAALNIADELFKERKHHSRLKAELKERMAKVLKMVRQGR
ncbi:MAG: cell division protein ZapA [Deltaproteobacteria bacterium]|nr:MAG: cell division protein ZapA [Deltaproteobacteria bacterium]